MKGFFQKLDKIDSLVRGPSNRDIALELVSLLTEPASSDYALKAIDERWLEPLESIGYFRNLESSNSHSIGTKAAFWPASAYLKRIASHSRENRGVAETLQRILFFIPEPTTLYAFRDIIDIAVLLPSEMRSGIAPLIQRVLDKNLSIEFSDVTVLLATLVEDGDSAEALRLFKSVFAIYPAKPARANDPDRRLLPNPGSFLSAWHYKEKMDKCLTFFTRAVGLRFLACLIQLLVDHLRFTNDPPSFQGPDDLSYIWRPSIESSDQNVREDIRDITVSAIRDCASLLASAGSAQFVAVSTLLNEQQWFIFTRILLFLLSTTDGAPQELVAHYSTQPYLFSEVTVRHEYALLLSNRFSTLGPSQQNAILKMIDNGPDKASYVQRFCRLHGRPLSDEELKRYVHHWQLDWLSFIKTNLPDQWGARYEMLRNELGAPQHPEFPFHMTPISGRLIPGDSRTVDDFSAVATLDRLLIEGATAEPPGHEFIDREQDSTIEDLHHLALSQPDLVLQRIQEILTLPPRFIAAISGGFRSGLNSKSSLQLRHLMTLSLAASTGLGSSKNESERRFIRDSLIATLDEILNDPRPDVDIDTYRDMREISSELLLLPDLSEVDRAPLASTNFDPLLSAINSPKGRVVENAIKTAVIGRRMRADEDGDGEGAEWLLARLSDLLSILPPDEVQIAAVLGYRFPSLVYISKKWASDHVAMIFPHSDEYRWRWEAAWCTYLAFAGAYNDSFEVLADEYQKAADEVSQKHLFKKSNLDPDRNLAQHLAIYYWRGLLPLQNPLLQTFLKRGYEDAVGSFVSYTGHGMKQVEVIPIQRIEELRHLLEWMVSDWKPRKGAKKSLAAFGWWLPNKALGDGGWRVRMLNTVLRKTGEILNLDAVLEMLEDLASDWPVQVVDSLGLLVRHDPGDMYLYSLATHAERILDKVAREARTVPRRKIAVIADYFGSKGHLQYRRFA